MTNKAKPTINFKMKGWGGFQNVPLRTDKTKGGPKKPESTPDPEITWENKTYSEPTVTTGEWEDVGGGTQQRKTTTKRSWQQKGSGRTTKFSDLENPEAAKKWIQENPEQYAELMRNKGKKQTRSGVEESENIETRKIQSEPAEPKRKVEGYAYRSQGAGSQSRGGSGTLEGARTAAQKFGNKEATDIDVVYDKLAYGEGGLGRLIQTKEAENLNKIREGAKTNPNWKKDLAAEKERFANLKKNAANWRKTGSHAENMPEELKPFQDRINKASERVQQKTTDKEKAYKSTRFN